MFIIIILSDTCDLLFHQLQAPSYTRCFVFLVTCSKESYGKTKGCCQQKYSQWSTKVLLLTVVNFFYQLFITNNFLCCYNCKTFNHWFGHSSVWYFVSKSTLFAFNQCIFLSVTLAKNTPGDLQTTAFK